MRLRERDHLPQGFHCVDLIASATFNANSFVEFKVLVCYSLQAVEVFLMARSAVASFGAQGMVESGRLCEYESREFNTSLCRDLDSR